MTVPGGIPLFLHYVSSKAAIVGLTRALARELGDWGIAVNAIAPDYVRTTQTTPPSSRRWRRRSRQRCFQRDMTADDLVGTLLYLVGPGAAFVTGQTLYVNGGRLFSGVVAAYGRGTPARRLLHGTRSPGVRLKSDTPYDRPHVAVSSATSGAVSSGSKPIRRGDLLGRRPRPPHGRALEESPVPSRRHQSSPTSRRRYARSCAERAQARR